ncbi:MAG: substrate-binding domain-containing protein [Verrucomicrobiota bacterium]
MPVTAPSIRSVALCIDTRDGAARHRLTGVMQVVHSLGWRIMMVRQTGEAAANEVLRLSPDGIIAYVAEAPLVRAAESLGIPLVDTAVGDVAVPMSVSLDNDALSRLALEHFRQAGLSHFGYCGVVGRVTSELRERCFKAGLGDPSMPAFSEPAAEGGSGLEALTKLLLGLPKPIGLLVFDDKLGERVLSACRWAGIKVPDEVAVIGIGNDELMCDLSSPSLSSCSIPIGRFGVEAAKMLAQAMAGGPVAQPHMQLQPNGVVARGSTDLVVTDDELVRAAVRHIRRCASGAIGVKEVAAALNVSRRTLDRRFSSALGRTVSDELLRVRMQLARSLLENGDLQVTEVAAACGYGSASSFSRAFRRSSGRWPSDYRTQIRSGR